MLESFLLWVVLAVFYRGDSVYRDGVGEAVRSREEEETGAQCSPHTADRKAVVLLMRQ